MTPKQLFDYAYSYARKSEAEGKGTQHPTIRQTAKRFKCTQQDIIWACDDYFGDGYLGVIVGFRTQAGTAEYPLGDCKVEAYRD